MPSIISIKTYSIPSRLIPSSCPRSSSHLRGAYYITCHITYHMLCVAVPISALCSHSHLRGHAALPHLHGHAALRGHTAFAGIIGRIGDVMCQGISSPPVKTAKTRPIQWDPWDLTPWTFCP